MSRSIKKCFAVMLALVVFVSGMSNMSLSTLADDTIQETTAISEETTDTKEDATPAKEDATPAKEGATPAKEDATPAKEDATLAEEDATVWEESTKDVTAELGRAENPVKKIVDTPLKKAVRAVPQAEGRHEAENSDSYTPENSAKVEIVADDWHKKFSGSGYVGNLNSYPQDDNGNDTRSYLTQKLYAKRPGKYLCQ